MVGGPAIVFTRRVVVDETFISKSTNLCKLILGIDACQNYPYSMCNQCLLDCIQDGTMTLNLKKSYLDGTKHALSKKWSFLIFNRLVRNVRLKAMLQLVDDRRFIALVLMEFVTAVTLSLKQWVVISITVHVKKLARH